MVGDHTAPALLRLVQRFNAGARFNLVQDTGGRIWPLYNTRSVPTSGIDGVPVVFFHGFGNDGYTWFPLFALLGSNRELVSLDLPGFGRHQPKEEDPFTPSWYASVCSNLVRELSIRWGQPPILVGKSMGGMIAGMVAAEIPDLCRALVLIAPSGIESPRVSEFWREYKNGTNVLLPSTEAEWERMVKMLYQAPRRIPGFVRRTALRTINRDRSRLETIFRSLLAEGYDPLGERLHRIKCPVTVVWGQEDRVMDPSGIERFRESLSSVDEKLISDCGHSPTSEALLETRNAILNVFSRYG